MKRLAAGVAASAVVVGCGLEAHAQSTATQIQEVVVTGRRGAPAVAGAISQVKQAGDVSIVTQDLFQHESPSFNAGQLINLLPGVVYESEDPSGLYSGDIRVHGLDGAHLGVTIDGSPVNDTGNYAVYFGEYLPAELTERIHVNIGSTEIDSPTASAVGGTISIESKRPSNTPETTFKVSGGDFSYQRIYAEVDSGKLGPTDLTSYLAFNYTSIDKWRGSGDGKRIGGDFRLYQPLHGNDFISLAGTYVQERLDFFYSGSAAQLAAYGKHFDYNTGYVTPTVTLGKADIVPSTAGPAGSDTNYYLLHPNPVDFATLRGTSRFSLTDKLTFTFDPSFFYTLANGGGATGISENDARLRAGGTQGVDLNHDGDTLDTVMLYTPSNTNTYRYVLLSSLVYDLNDQNSFQLSYTGDHGLHRQTGEYSYQYGGTPADVFGGKSGYGPRVYAADGSYLRGRDRFSVANLNQVAGNYVGKFLDDALHVNIGVRAPFFERNLHQFCYTYNGTSQYCTTASSSAILAAYNSGVVAKNSTALAAYVPGVTFNNSTGTPNFRFPFAQTFKFSKALPNAGATYNFGPSLVYVSYAEGFSAPKTDDLYTSASELVKPESSTTYSGGYRFQTHAATASISGYDTEYRNRIVQSYDPNDPTLSIDRNVGSVRIYGMDAEVGVRPISHLALYATASLLKSELESNIFVTLAGKSVALPTQGKELVLTPDQQYSGRAQYEIGPFVLGFAGKYISRRYISDVNDASVPGYATFDADLRYNIMIPALKETFLQANLTNLLDRTYFTRISTVNTAQGVATSAGTLGAGTPFFYYGAPRTFIVTLQAKF